MPDKGAWAGSRRKCHAYLCCQTFTGSCAFPHMAPSFFIHKGLSDFPCQSAVSRPAHTAGRQLGPYKKSFPAVSGKGLFMIYDTLEIGRRIQKLRREKGLTQEQLAERLNVSTVHLAKIETGKRGCSLDILLDFASFLTPASTTWYLGKFRTARCGRGWMPLSKPWRICGEICDWSEQDQRLVLLRHKNITRFLLNWNHQPGRPGWRNFEN